MNRATTVIIGAGQAGLAMSHYLTERSIDHVLLERGEVANSWRNERWDSLRLLTPNWQTRLPGHAYDGPDPDGFMGTAEVARFISGYARAIEAPVESQTTVMSVRRTDDGYQIVTDRGTWNCRTLVLASGACNIPSVPALASELPSSIASFTSMDYRNPDQLPEGGVMVVGGSATGVQLADEIQRSGRPVTLSIGEHVRMPRTYRGHDVLWWMDASGVWDQRYDEVDDIKRARGVPSPQLVGTPEHRTLDVNALTAAGVQVVGRLAGIRDGRVLFSGSLRNLCTMADLKMNRLLDTFDEWVARHGHGRASEPPLRFEPTRVPESPRLSLDLGSGEIRSVVWATGYRPDYSWLDVPVLDRKGRLRHEGGVVDSPGLYALGLTFLRRRKSTFIHGVDDDARELAAHLAEYLANDPLLPRQWRSLGLPRPISPATGGEAPALARLAAEA